MLTNAELKKISSILININSGFTLAIEMDILNHDSTVLVSSDSNISLVK